MLASKIEEVKYIDLNQVHNNMVHGKYTKNEILSAEMELLKIIKFQTAQPTILDLLYTLIS